MSGISWDGIEGSGELPTGDSESEPEEKLAFALADGRVGVLSVKGRKVPPSLPSLPLSQTLPCVETKQ
jgi:hypothetical protein